MNERYRPSPERIQGIYFITDSDSQIVCIGESRNIPARFEDHRLLIESGISPDSYQMSNGRLRQDLRTSDESNLSIFPVQLMEGSTKKNREHVESCLIKALKPIGKCSPPNYDRRQIEAGKMKVNEILFKQKKIYDKENF